MALSAFAGDKTLTERFNKTLKQQIVYGRIYKNVEELRPAVEAFVETCNHNWLIENLALNETQQNLR